MRKNKIKVEICAQSLTSALIAQEGGADRIELCAALEIGGITPSYATLKEVKKRLNIEICVLIRPRGGDFFYSDLEYEIIKQDILFCKELGVDGVVVGVLRRNKEIDTDKMKELLELARPMQVACHRAFDQTPDGLVAMEQLIELGYDRILTCGQAEDVLRGKEKLKQLIEKANGRIAIMPGNGVTLENAMEILNHTKAQDIHMTAKQLIISPMKNENDFLNGIKDAINNNYYETSLDTVKKIISLINQ